MLLAETLLHQARLLLWRREAAEASASAASAAEFLRRQRRSAYRAQAEMLRAEARLVAGVVGDDELRAAQAAARRLDRAGFQLEGVDGQLVVARLAQLAGSQCWKALSSPTSRVTERFEQTTRASPASSCLTAR